MGETNSYNQLNHNLNHNLIHILPLDQSGSDPFCLLLRLNQSQHLISLSPLEVHVDLVIDLAAQRLRNAAMTAASVTIASSHLLAQATTADALQTLHCSLLFTASRLGDWPNLANLAASPHVAEAHHVLVAVDASAVAATDLGAEATVEAEASEIAVTSFTQARVEANPSAIAEACVVLMAGAVDKVCVEA